MLMFLLLCVAIIVPLSCIYSNLDALFYRGSFLPTYPWEI